MTGSFSMQYFYVFFFLIFDLDQDVGKKRCKEINISFFSKPFRNKHTVNLENNPLEINTL